MILFIFTITFTKSENLSVKLCVWEIYQRTFEKNQNNLSVRFMYLIWMTINGER